MMKNASFIAVLLLQANLMFAQQVVFNFTNAPYTIASSSIVNLNISELKISTGVIKTNVVTGTYFSSEPYIEIATGWNQLDTATAKHLSFKLKANPNYVIQLQKINFDAYATSSGPSKIIVAANNQIIKNLELTSSKLINVATNSLPNEYAEIEIKIYGLKGTRETTGGGSLKIDDISLTLDVHEIPDTTPPILTTCRVLNKSQVLLYFNERLNEVTVNHTENITINRNRCKQLTFANTEHNSLLVELSNTLSDNTITIETVSISDTENNISIGQNCSCNYTPLLLTDVYISSDRLVILSFNKPPNDWVLAESYLSSDSNIKFVSAVIANNNPKQIWLMLEQPLVQDQEFTLKVRKITDEYSDFYDFDIPLRFHEIQRGDVIFNELMTDINPSPRVLPASKYIELYNRTDFPIKMSKWKLTINSDTIILPTESTIQPKQMLVLSDQNTNGVNAFLGTSLAILPTSYIKVTQNTFTLTTPDQTLVDEFNYNNSFYENSTQAEGGTSLERVDNLNICIEQNNWKASLDYKGGTPGTINSVTKISSESPKLELITTTITNAKEIKLEFNGSIKNGSTKNIKLEYNDQIQTVLSILIKKNTVTLFTQIALKPAETFSLTCEVEDLCGKTSIINSNQQFNPIHVDSLVCLSNYQLLIKFSEAPKQALVAKTDMFYIDGIGHPSSISQIVGSELSYLLEFPIAFTSGNKYLLKVNGIPDNIETYILNDNIEFTWYLPHRNDLLISEIMVYPLVGECRFIEIYNNSSYPINLQDYAFCVKQEVGVSNYPLCSTRYNIEPKQHIAFATDLASINKTYRPITEATLIKIKSLPAYDYKGDLIWLCNNSGKTMDSIEYRDDYQFKLLSDNGRGVSLERINNSENGNDPSNWHSASSLANYGTPGYANSQAVENEAHNTIEITPQIFSPDNDGLNDFLTITIPWDGVSAECNITIFDKQGRFVRHLSKNILLATNNAFVWDGINEVNQRADVGIYIIFVEIIAKNGYHSIDKKTCVLALKTK